MPKTTAASPDVAARFRAILRAVVTTPPEKRRKRKTKRNAKRPRVSG